MAPRKDATGPPPSASQTQQDASSDGIEEFELPKVLIAQLAESALSSDAKLEEDTITALVKGSTVFMNYLTATAQDITASRAHKTISGADVLKALEVLEFGELVAAFQDELEAFRQSSKTDKGKSKAVADVKGKERDTTASSVKRSAASAEIVQMQDVRAPELSNAENRVSGTDVEMRNENLEEPPHSLPKPVILPIE